MSDENERRLTCPACGYWEVDNGPRWRDARNDPPKVVGWYRIPYGPKDTIDAFYAMDKKWHPRNGGVLDPDWWLDPGEVPGKEGE